MQNTKDAVEHLKTHQSYPATKAELIAECDNLSDFSEEDKKWFMEHLTKESYETAKDVMDDLGLQEVEE